MNQTTDAVIVFADSEALRSPARKAYYGEVFKFAEYWLTDLPDGALRPLKALFFQGLLVEGRGKGLRVWEPFLICLCVPELDKQFIIDTFSVYKEIGATYSVNMYRVYFDGQNHCEHPEVVRRFDLIVEALADEQVRFVDGGGFRVHYAYIDMYCRVFGTLQRGNVGGASCLMGARVARFIEGKVETFSDNPVVRQKLDSLTKILAVILGGAATNPDEVYRFPFLVDFLDQFFSGQLPPFLQRMVSDVYESCSQKVTMKDGRVVTI